ncbi:hypothetical protein MXD62_19295 [Frankia sp. Mgl5]|uniref:hypothetical protein n=1 Tax=Frankia sp. Mgl5 TaxID=2933793 RepID=UPI00200C5B16|nr:hypothetical protein [Frankia sp. Mgl5]MCK9929297.1 hypothetical protein [Frankia sp. Mgl5]
MTALVPAADLEPTAEQIARARRDFAACADYTAAAAELSISTVHVEALAVALAAGDMRVVTARVREMLAVRRAYVERRAELDAALNARRAAVLAVDTEPAEDPDATMRQLAELSAQAQIATGGAL